MSQQNESMGGIAGKQEYDYNATDCEEACEHHIERSADGDLNALEKDAFSEPSDDAESLDVSGEKEEGFDTDPDGENGREMKCDLANQASSDKTEDEKSRKKRYFLYGSVSIVAIVVIVVSVLISGILTLKVRMPGMWPDFAYLATLIDNPDAFVRALNCSGLQDAYDQAKRKGQWDEPIVAEIDIEDLEENGTNVGEGIVNPGISVRFDDSGQIAYFQLVYMAPSKETIPVQADDGNYFLHMLVAGALSGLQYYGVTAISEDEVLDYARIVREDCEVVDPLIHDTLYDSSSILSRCGINANDVKTTSASTGKAEWTDGYFLSCSSHGAAALVNTEIPTITAGTIYTTHFDVSGVENGTFLYAAQDLNSFVWVSGQLSDLLVRNDGAITICFAREGYTDESVTAKSWASDAVGNRSLDIWKFKEGEPVE